MVEDVNEFAPKWKIHDNGEPAQTLATGVSVEEGQLLEEVMLSGMNLSKLSWFTTLFWPYQVIRVEAVDEDCSPHFGDICGYDIESQGQPFTITKEGTN